jgi:hypothetical protein
MISSSIITILIIILKSLACIAFITTLSTFPWMYTDTYIGRDMSLGLFTICNFKGCSHIAPDCSTDFGSNVLRNCPMFNTFRITIIISFILIAMDTVLEYIMMIVSTTDMIKKYVSINIYSLYSAVACIIMSISLATYFGYTTVIGGEAVSFIPLTSLTFYSFIISFGIYMIAMITKYITMTRDTVARMILNLFIGLIIFSTIFMAIFFPIELYPLIGEDEVSSEISQSVYMVTLDSDIMSNTNNNNNNNNNNKLFEPVTIAFFGDSFLGFSTIELYNILKNVDQVEAIAPIGDLDYEKDPQGWIDQIINVFGSSIPIFMIAGNHDVVLWQDYQQVLRKYWTENGQSRYCNGIIGARHVCIYKGILITQLAIGDLTQIEYPNWLNQTLLNQAERYPDYWKVVTWHHNANAYQLATDGTLTTTVYDIARQYKTISFAGHNHVYARTKLMQQYADPPLISTRPDFNNATHVKISNGENIHIVVGTGGRQVQTTSESLRNMSYWQTTLTAETSNPIFRSGVVVCTFYYQGQQDTTYCYLRDLDGNKRDEFYMYM